MLFSYLTSNFCIQSLHLMIFTVSQENFVLEVPTVKNIRNLNLTRKSLEKHELKYLFHLFVPADLRTKKQSLG